MRIDLSPGEWAGVHDAVLGQALRVKDQPGSRAYDLELAADLERIAGIIRQALADDGERQHDTGHYVDGISEPQFGIQMGPGYLTTHGPEKCAGRACVIHAPSDHHMREWRTNWRSDRQLMERMCPHGVGHPDPDDLAYQLSIGRKHAGVHGCDGCCAPPEHVYHVPEVK